METRDGVPGRPLGINLTQMAHVAKKATVLRDKDFRSMGRVPPNSFTVGDVRCVLDAASEVLTARHTTGEGESDG